MRNSELVRAKAKKPVACCSRRVTEIWYEARPMVHAVLAQTGKRAPTGMCAPVLVCRQRNVGPSNVSGEYDNCQPTKAKPTQLQLLDGFYSTRKTARPHVLRCALCERRGSHEILNKSPDNHVEADLLPSIIARACTDPMFYNTDIELCSSACE